jgi:LICD Protein Family.
VKTLIKRLIVYPIARPFGPHFWAMRLEKLATRYPFETSDYVGCVAMGKYGTGERMPKDAYLKSADVTFEGHSFKTMSCWEMYLSGIYGDWRTPPAVPGAPHPNRATMNADAFERIRTKFPEILERR